MIRTVWLRQEYADVSEEPYAPVLG